MSEVNTDKEHKPSNRLEIAEFFSEASRGAGKVSFKITYTNTDGNRDIDQRFLDFCFKNANNEYLMGIKLLLDSYDRLKDRIAMEAYMKMLELRIIDLEDKINKDSPQKELWKEDKKENKEVKTF